MNKYIVFDIGGTYIKWAIISENYTIIENSKFAFDGKKDGAKNMIDEIGLKIMELEKKYEIKAIGISTAGIVDPQTTKILSEAANIKNYKNIVIRNELKRFTNKKVFVENDANAAVMGESTEKDLEKYKDILLMTLGTDIGGGIILDNKIYYGHSKFAGEIGYQIVDNRRWGDFCSAKGLINLVKERNDVVMTTYDILESKDKNIQKTLNYWYESIAKGITNILVLMNFEAIIIGGGISESNLFNLQLINENVNKYLLEPEFTTQYKLFKAKKGNNAAIIGMAKIINNGLLDD